MTIPTEIDLDDATADEPAAALGQGLPGVDAQHGRSMSFRRAFIYAGFGFASFGLHRTLGSDAPGVVRVALMFAIALLGARMVVHVGYGVFGPNWDSGLWMAVAWVGLVAFVAVFASILPLNAPDDAEFAKKEERPSLSFDEPLGRDEFGRSELSRVAYGARVSLGIGVGAAALGAIIGGALGLFAGYVRGWADGFIGLLTDSMLAFPPLILLISLVSVLPKTATTIAIGVGILSIPPFIRLSRATTLQYAQREFVLAARCLGLTRRRILLREVLPNVALPLFAYTFIVIALVIVAEGSLSYLGVGIQPPQASWGRMIADGQPRFDRAPHLVFVPSIVMFITLLAFNRIGERLRVILAPAGRS